MYAVPSRDGLSASSDRDSSVLAIQSLRTAPVPGVSQTLSMLALPLQETVATLTDLAEQGAIDPWDVRVIEAIDNYLHQLQEVIATTQGWQRQAAYEAHLSQSAQAFVSAAMLVLLKADRLSQSEFPPEPEEDEDFAAMDDEIAAEIGAGRMPTRLEQWLKRRGVAQPVTQRRVSLEEMIGRLQEVATLLSSRPPRPRSPKAPSRRQKVRAIRQLAHQENLSELAAALDTFLRDRGDRHACREGWIDLNALLALLPPGMASAPGHDTEKPVCGAAAGPTKSERVGVFWALLLLSSQSKVELSQDCFYQDLRIRTLDLPATHNPANMPRLPNIPASDSA